MHRYFLDKYRRLYNQKVLVISSVWVGIVIILIILSLSIAKHSINYLDISCIFINVWIVYSDYNEIKSISKEIKDLIKEAELTASSSILTA